MLLVGVLIATGCGGGAGGGGLGSNSITQKQYDALHVGETATAVRSALAKPESITKTDISGIGHSETWTYSGPSDAIVLLEIGHKMSTSTFKPVGPLVLQSKTIG